MREERTLMRMQVWATWAPCWAHGALANEKGSTYICTISFLSLICLQSYLRSSISQDQHKEKSNHSHSHLQSPVNRTPICTSLDCGRRQIQCRRNEHVNTQTPHRKNREPSCCEATTPTTAPPFHSSFSYVSNINLRPITTWVLFL